MTQQSISKPRTKWLWVAGIIVAIAVAAGFCSYGYETEMEQAVCNDLDSGRNVMQIKPPDMNSKVFAEYVNGAIRDHCPANRSKPGVQGFLSNWGY